MKNLFAGLLIAVVGAGIFIYVRKTKGPAARISATQEWIVGKWAGDSATVQPGFGLSCEFLPDGQLIKSAGDSAKTDTSVYEWTGKDELKIQQNAKDSVGLVFAAKRVGEDTLMLTRNDHLTILRKLKGK